jgi:Bacteriophage related domain of unknown function
MSSSSVHADIRAAVRTKLLGLAVASRSVSTISASGSVFSDSSNGLAVFAVGDELTASGFTNPANNGSFMVTAVAAGAVTVDGTLTTETAGARLLTVTLPQGRAWEGRTFTPTIGRPHVAEVMSPVSSSLSALGTGGTMAHTILSNFSVRCPSGRGTISVERLAGALMELFKPGTSLSYGQTSGTVMQSERRALLVEPDWLSCPVNITSVSYTFN